MYGAIIGDLAGSIYEYNEFIDSSKGIINTERRLEILTKKNIIEEKSFYSDDTILTIAILDSILNNVDYEIKLRQYGLKYMEHNLDKRNYFEYMFSPNFIKWCKGECGGKSNGNGCMMRISPVGFLFDSIEEIEKNTLLATIPSHNNEYAIKSATIVSTIIYMARLGRSKDEIKEHIENKYNIELKYDLLKLQKSNVFDGTCKVLEKCLYILFISNNYEEAIKNAISIGGDTDTIACIVGSMAEALYGIPKYLIDMVKKKLPDEFIYIIENGYKRINNIKRVD